MVTASPVTVHWKFSHLGFQSSAYCNPGSKQLLLTYAKNQRTNKQRLFLNWEMQSQLSFSEQHNSEMAVGDLNVSSVAANASSEMTSITGL